MDDFKVSNKVDKQGEEDNHMAYKIDKTKRAVKKKYDINVDVLKITEEELKDGDNGTPIKD